MKKLYWRPQRISARILILIAGISILGLASVEFLKITRQQQYYNEKLKAAKITKVGFQVIRQAREKLNVKIDPLYDPSESGLIGVLSSEVTTNTGHLPAKQTSVNPNFSALTVHYLKQAGIKEGDVVAVGLSGSFPAMNTAVIIALEALNTRPVIICSAGASQWGANIPDFVWPEIHKILLENNVIKTKIAAASLGGLDDRALGLSSKGKKILEDSIKRDGIKFLAVKNFSDSLEKRMAIFREEAGDSKIKAYINVGGGTTSVGTNLGKRVFKPGLNRRLPYGTLEVDSVMSRFSQEGIPIIHFTHVDELADRYGFPLQPVEMPLPGQGKIFFRKSYNKWLAGGVILVIISLLVIFVRLDWGFRLLGSRQESHGSRPEPMI